MYPSRRRAFIEEGTIPPEPRSSHARRDPLRGVLDHRIVDRPVGHRADQIRRSRLAARTSRDERHNDLVNLRVQFLGRHDFVDQADFAGARSADPLRSQKIPASCRSPIARTT